MLISLCLFLLGLFLGHTMTCLCYIRYPLIQIMTQMFWGKVHRRVELMLGFAKKCDVTTTNHPVSFLLKMLQDMPSLNQSNPLLRLQPSAHSTQPTPPTPSTSQPQLSPSTSQPQSSPSQPTESSDHLKGDSSSSVLNLHRRSLRKPSIHLK